VLNRPNSDPQEFVEYRIIRLAEQLRRRFEAALRPHGLSPHQFSVLAVLRARPGVTAAELARTVLLTPQSMGAIVEQLERSGLVEPRERRGRGVPAPTVLSREGAATLQSALASVQALDRDTRAALGADEPGLDAGLRRLERTLLGGTSSAP
jgi:DNA-binding MarR family transcriptional regulator